MIRSFILLYFVFARFSARCNLLYSSNVIKPPYFFTCFSKLSCRYGYLYSNNFRFTLNVSVTIPFTSMTSTSPFGKYTKKSAMYVIAYKLLPFFVNAGCKVNLGCNSKLEISPAILTHFNPK